jgi:hypothetical protein
MVARSGRLLREIAQRSGRKQHFIRVAVNARPAEIADPIDDFGRRGARVGQIAAVEDQIGGGFA